ncbi:TetR/AcrR family transcriptional regulator [Paenibacillus tarimensis]|uniref:TetR/AcrR family transcriptional regulator n=1 Tax=Paenibacillus tarimensis TaxID=416012 RepID=UPI001F416941|nr:TetR/AcrR family transcriptional regulator [Paenibacillus tarimensis]MCF2944207.1 TetR/AcrR family transcriptional regulator [Paenibacillus tarimensis]
MSASQIKAVAREMFAESGYDGVKLAEIAKAVGIKTPSIYAHFESKEQLFLSLFAEAAESERWRLANYVDQSTSPSGPLEDRLKAVYDYYTDPEAGGMQAFLKKTMLMPPKLLKPKLQHDFIQYEKGVSEMLGGMLQQAMEKGEIREQAAQPLINVFYALIDGLLVESQLYSREIYRERQQMIWQYYWQSVKG